jgi:hypothetical protein
MTIKIFVEKKTNDEILLKLKQVSEGLDYLMQMGFKTDAMETVFDDVNTKIRQSEEKGA